MDGRKGSGLVTRRRLIGATLLGAGALLAACTGAAPTPAPGAKPTEAPKPAAPAPATKPAEKPAAEPTKPVEAAKPAAATEKVTIRVFNRGHPLNEILKGGADEYGAAHPNVTIQWESAPPGEDLRKMLVQAAAGTSPDVQWQCLLCNFYQFVLVGQYIDLDPLVKARTYDLNQHIPSAVQAGTHGGKLYGMPHAMHPSYPCVIINKTMFEKGGVPIPKEEWTDGPHPGWKDWTYDAMQQAAITLTKREGARTTQWGLQMRGYANPFPVLVAAIRGEGSDYLNKEGTKLQFDTAEGRKAIGYYSDLYTKHKVAPLTADMPSGGPDLMASNRVAIRNAPVWAIATAQQTFKDFEWRVLPAPRGAAGVDGFVEPNFFSINKVSKNPETAFDVLLAISDAKWGWKAVEAGGIPGSHKEFWTPDSKLAKDPNFAVFARMMNTVTAPLLPANGTYAELSTKSNAEMEPIFLGQQVESDKIIKEITPKLQAILEKKPATIEELAKPQ